MSNYYLILIWIAFFGFMGMFVQMKRSEIVCGQKVERMQWLWAIVLVAPLVWWTANRGWIADTGMYMRSFWDMPGSLSGIPAYMKTVTKDEGFYFISAVIKALITKSEVTYFLIIGAIQAFLLFRVYRKYSTKYTISFFLFIASTDYVSWMFNGMRQFTAVAITMIAFQLMLDKKYIKAIIIVLIASLFHQSALLVIPFIFVVQGDAWNIRTLLFIVAIIVVVASVDKFTNLLDGMLAETQYTNVVSDWQQGGDDGTNLFRVLVYSVPTLFSLLGLRFIRKVNDPVINICTNMSIVAVGFYVISMFTSGIFIGRLPIYFSLYNYILLPWEIDHIFEEKSSFLIYIGMIVAYLGFYFLQIRMVWGLA